MKTVGVYIIRNDADEVLYVGSSGDIDKRLAHHSACAAWWPKNALIERIPTETRALAFYQERETIHALSPKFNRVGRGGAKSKSRIAGPVVRPRPDALANVIDAYGSVAAVARAVGCDHMTLSDIWRGVHYPSGKLIARLIVVTGIPFDELFFVDADDEAPINMMEKRAPRTPRNLPTKPVSA